MTSVKLVNETTAMLTTAVNDCVKILSEAVASLSIHVYCYKEGGRKEMVPDHYLYQVLHIPGLGFDGLIGYSPIAMAKNAIGMTLGLSTKPEQEKRV